jgi:2-dehydropantoate 2-reductase
MRVCVYGPGAIGGHVAARLVNGGVDVSVIVRPTTAAVHVYLIIRRRYQRVCHSSL